MHSWRKVFIVSLLAGVGAGLCGPAWAEIDIHVVTIPYGPTNWYGSLTVSKFDNAPCVLDSICFRLTGNVIGDGRFESQDDQPATVTMNLQVAITIRRPDTTPLVTALPVAQTVDNVTAFDGVVDFGGTSGRSYADLSGLLTEWACTSSDADIALFTGAGAIVLPASAIDVSSLSGPEAFVFNFTTYTSAALQVWYYYTCPVGTEQTTWSSIKGLFR